MRYKVREKNKIRRVVKGMTREKWLNMKVKRCVRPTVLQGAEMWESERGRKEVSRCV